jgi:hypothetical protein
MWYTYGGGGYVAEKAYILNGERVTKDEYNKAKFDRFLVTVQKGRKLEIQAHAEARGESVNGFINRAIDHEMERDMEGDEAE